MRSLYIIRDNLANSILNEVIQAHASDASAVRTFSDIINLPNSPIAAHPGDYDLVCIGQLLDYNTEGDELKAGHIKPDYRVIINAKTWLDANAAKPNTDTNTLPLQLAK